MKSLSNVLLCLIFFATVSAFAAEPFKLDLKDIKTDELPKGWKGAKTGDGPGSVWKVVEDSTAPGGKAIIQTSADGSNSLLKKSLNKNCKKL
jgi:hypothetical protein